MSGDLEDFLRRAAQRRQAKAAQQPAAPQRQRPQYSDRRTERVARDVDAEPILTAEIVEDDPNSFSARLRRVEEAKKAAAKAQAEAANKLAQVRAGRSRGSASSSSQGSGNQGSGNQGSGTAVAMSGDPTQDLLRLLRQPGGIRQAILLREILDRPEHRW